MVLTKYNVEQELRDRYDLICDNDLEIPSVTLMRLLSVYNFIILVGGNASEEFEVVTKIPGGLDDTFKVILTIESVAVHDDEIQFFRDAVLSSESFRVDRIDDGDDSAVKLTFTFPARP